MPDHHQTTPRAIAPSPQTNQRIGVIGGGQLAWMLAGAAPALGLKLVIQTPRATDPAVATAPLADPHWPPPQALLAPIDDMQATTALADRTDMITFENEFVNLATLQPLADQGVCFYPSLSTLACLLDKYQQRCYFQALGLPTPQFLALGPDWVTRVPPFGWPLVLKTRRHGYDGQGTFIVQEAAALQTLAANLGDVPLLLEEFVPFERELAVIAARSVQGEVVVYPVAETHQVHQVCRWVLVPAAVSDGVVQEIRVIAQTLLQQLEAVGVFGLEFFLTRDNRVLLNEVAPRTHNSGHYTLDACSTSQFEQHLRAIAHLPLGDPALVVGGAVMVNLLGCDGDLNYQAKRQQLAAIPGAHVYWYGKTQPRLGRKLGHVTVLLDAPTPNALRTQGLVMAQKIEQLWYGPKG